LVFCLSIAAAAFLLRVHGGLGIALLASIAYICYGLLETRGVLEPPGSVGAAAARGSNFLQTYMHVSVFFLVGAVGGYLAERTNRKGQALDSAEAELKQLRVDTDNVLRNMSSGVLVIDSEGRVLTMNPTAEDILELERPDVESQHIDSVFGPQMPELTKELAGALESERSKSRHEITVRRRGSSELPLGISISLLKDNDGTKRGIIAVFQDLTEVRNMQDRVRKADRLAAIGELSAGIAHEIRNPLASISGSIEMLSNELQLSGENERLMDLIMKESDRLDRIISDFLEFARLRPPSKDDVVVGEIVDEVVVLLKNNSAVSSRIVTDIDAGVDPWLLRVDEEQMKQVFINLAINACEAMGSTGTLTICSAVHGDDSLMITFQDEGEGISQEAKSRLFEPFFTTKEGGTGLGLAIANKIVEAHGGTIDVCNRKNGGADVSVVFPISTLRKRPGKEHSSVV
jgi:two-component system sensor histidine kinase PilS (NtrC family)